MNILIRENCNHPQKITSRAIGNYFEALYDSSDPEKEMDLEQPVVRLESVDKGSVEFSKSSNSPIHSGFNSPTARRLSNNSSQRRRSNSRNSRTSSGRNVKSSNDISSSSKIFRNLLILEDDLRKQAHRQKVLKWQFTIFLSCLMGVAGFAFYELYFTNESVKGFYRFILQFTLLFITITVSLFHLSGEYKRTIIIPRRFFTSTNKGIRQFNVKLVKVHSSWNEKFTDFIRFTSRKVAHLNIYMLTCVLRLSQENMCVKFWRSVTIRSQPRIGAVDVKLMLHPKAFGAEIREGWEIYRDEFWAREGSRRRKQTI
ncbi:hypothetical protein HG535_0E03080 [Zygotorulaspora mrakii]|uniref:Sporulation-specific protein SPO7 n=1 Tax=Zygotorulaspora mrakii TaxID=42260 RepID=A0A7H9B4D1_ZYGMR|nr:uncharacterized protein HG535_0E03080 [Zygotorulaspora mrakii]QLG73224.1 hypothetical protein HG535_0E03080 [Zygotorulaspora mrakii]